MLAKHIKLGKEGEEIAVKHLMKHQYQILDRNYSKKWGEIDIVAEKDGTLHFVEVKTVSYETNFDECLPEENIHSFKRKRLTKAINTYLAEKKVTHETDFQVDAMAIYLNPETKESKIRLTENIIL
jgi:putative endonuclease